MKAERDLKITLVLTEHEAETLFLETAPVAGSNTVGEVRNAIVRMLGREPEENPF